MAFLEVEENQFNTTVLTSSDNLNNITDFGVYSWSSSYPTNSPLNGAASMMVIRYGTNSLQQIVFGSTNHIYIREYSGGTWSAWSRDVIYDTISTGTITKASGITGDLANTTCYKKNGVVCVAGRLLSTSASADHAIFKIPSGFRPNIMTYCAGGARTTAGWQLGSVDVTTAGDVEFKITTNTADAFYFSACYPAAD